MTPCLMISDYLVVNKTHQCDLVSLCFYPLKNLAGCASRPWPWFTTPVLHISYEFCVVKAYFFKWQNNTIRINTNMLPPLTDFCAAMCFFFFLATVCLCFSEKKKKPLSTSNLQTFIQVIDSLWCQPVRAQRVVWQTVQQLQKQT